MRCVVLAGKHQGLCEAIRGLLEGVFEVIVMVADEPSLMEALEGMKADAALVDLSLPGDGGARLLGRVRARFPDLTLIAMGASGETGVRHAVAVAGADAFMAKSAIATDLLPTVDLLISAKRGATRDRSPENSNPEGRK